MRRGRLGEPEWLARSVLSGRCQLLAARSLHLRRSGAGGGPPPGSGIAHLGLAPVVAWLAARRDRVPCAAPAVVHRDFHPASIVMRPAGGVAVSAWTSLTVTVPRHDLVWTLLPAGSYAGPAVRAAILEAYKRYALTPAHPRRARDILAGVAADDQQGDVVVLRRRALKGHDSRQQPVAERLGRATDRDLSP